MIALSLDKASTLHSLPVGHARFQSDSFIRPWIWLPSAWTRRTGNAQENMKNMNSIHASVCLWQAEAQKLYTWAGKTPMLRFYIHRVPGMIKLREKYSRGGNEFPSSCSFIPSRLWNLTTASYKAKSYLCLFTALYWMGARGKADSRAARDRNTLFHTSELFGRKSKLKGGKTLHWKKSTQENLAHFRFRKSIWPIEMKIKAGCRLNFWSLKTLGSTSESTLTQKAKEEETA